MNTLKVVAKSVVVVVKNLLKAVKDVIGVLINMVKQDVVEIKGLTKGTPTTVVNPALIDNE